MMTTSMAMLHISIMICGEGIFHHLIRLYWFILFSTLIYTVYEKMVHVQLYI